MEIILTLQFKANAVVTPASTQRLFNAGKVPGNEASKNDTLLFTADRNAEEDGENSFVLETIWACTSNPTTLLHFLRKINY